MGRATQWDNQAFTFVRDLVLQMVQSVVILGEVFNQVNAFSIPNAAAAQVAFVADPALATLGPYANNNPDTDQYCTQRIMYPHWYVNLFLNQGLPPHWVWEVVMAAVIANNVEAACTPLLDWLRAACMQTTVNGVPMDASPITQLLLAALVADKDLL